MDITEALGLKIQGWVEKYQAHSVLLYGSHAKGEADDSSDVDVAVFAPVNAVIRDTSFELGWRWDVFIHPEAKLDTAAEDSLHMRSAQILLDEKQRLRAWQSELWALYERGPKPLPADEQEARRNWLSKMLARIERGDTEGHYRRAWLLTSLLEDYFHLRGRWYEGPKRSLQILQQEDARSFEMISRALEPQAGLSDTAAAVQCVLDTA